MSTLPNVSMLLLTSCKAWNATHGNPTEPQFSSAKDDVTPDGSTHSNGRSICSGVYVVWVTGAGHCVIRRLERWQVSLITADSHYIRWNALIRQGWRTPIHFEWGDVILCRTEMWLRWVPLHCISFHALLAAGVEKCSTFREATHASANQITFHA